MKKHIILTSHPAPRGARSIASPGAAPDAAARGPIIGAPHERRRNVIGTHSGAYALYRAPRRPRPAS